MIKTWIKSGFIKKNKKNITRIDETAIKYKKCVIYIQY